MSDIHGSTGGPPVRRALGRACSGLVAALLAGMLSACGGVNLRPDSSLPRPLVQAMPVTAGLLVDEELRSYVHDESRGGTDWHVELGASHEKFFQSIFGSSLATLQVFHTLDEAQAAPGLQAIFVPHIEQYSFATARETSGGYWAVTIRYRIGVLGPGGEPVDALTLTGYGSAQGNGSSSTSLTTATRVAMRDAAAKFLVQLPRLALAGKLREGQVLGPSDRGTVAVDVIEVVPIEPAG